MKNEIYEILSKYTAGEITVYEANKMLVDIGAIVYLDPEKLGLSQSEIDETVVGEAAVDATGMGLLDTGTGNLDKVFVQDGKLADIDCGSMSALCIIGGKTYRVQGDTLVD